MVSRLIYSLLFALAGPVSAHEFWIAPEQYQVPAGGTITADLRNGEHFNGSRLPYLPRRFERFDWISAAGIAEVEGRAGDLPAVRIEGAPEGLAVLAYGSTERQITYKAWEKFAAFAAHKGFADVETWHDDRDLPRDGFVESYRRYPKALVAVGHGRGTDRATGLETEFIAEANPYVPGFTSPLPVLLLYQDAPRAQAQVEVFDKAPDGAVTITTQTTDADGRAQIPVEAGHSYMLDAVVLRVPDGPTDAAWETLWATLTFAVP
ncbi:Uncharacterized conserved protein, contains GH25 family domain [Poseidonocella pacifica]|uniref:Uncharacterized conserved protein, contains GH25 family domain n=1 Tax=Poseidonocella pacifica TaxID=871651 RepID=A0A1I0VLY8_9RHOB|nr:DUF4198 domain-containing protein [Poseidonocella pacifica]SFA77238.1 Uncharacterized conserved protein, contains GH25 family domain [Poseidonocella pacifica]